LDEGTVLVACFDVAVAGGGPAGAFAARELARAGKRVILIDPAISRPRLEGMGERVARLLSAKGLDGCLEAASEPVKRRISWAGLQNSVNQERIVLRHDFDASLRQAALEAGAELRKARVLRVQAGNPDTSVRLELSTGEQVEARLLIEARGRQAPSTVRRKGPQTLAIAGPVRGLETGSETQVVTSPQGWLWSAHDPACGSWVQVCVDAGSMAKGGQDGLARRVEGFLVQSEIKKQIGALGFSGLLSARGAGLVLAVPELSLPVIPVGDAAVAIDPLSGHGLFWALSSALSAIVIVLTLLEGPHDGKRLAERFYRDRVVETFWRQARVGRDFYRLEDRYSHHAFWSERRTWPDDKPAHKAVEAAFLERRVVVHDNRLVERDVLVTPKVPEGVAFVAGVPVTELLRTAQGFEEMSPGAARPPMAAALRWLAQQGLSAAPGKILKNTDTKKRETA